MKTYILKPTMTPPTLNRTARGDKPAMVATVPPRQPLPRPVLDPNKPLLKLGLDVHLEFLMAVGQRDHASPLAPRQFTREALVTQVRQWVAEGLQVFCVQESCGFGFTLHRQLVGAGAQSFLITPIALNGQRKTDKLDARALCLRLSRWLDGNRDELKPIRIPSEAEQRKREGTRRRKFLQRLIRMLANRGHGQVAEYQHVKLPGHWWGPRNWKKLSDVDAWLREQLAALREVIVGLEAQLEVLEAELIARVKDQTIPKGLGEISLVTLDGEVCAWERFNNRKAMGSYTGCCPGEHSSGGKRRLGSIDRLGNGKVRTILVEAVWRLLRWQPHWKAALKYRARLREGAAIKKKTVVALARQLAIDLWRWRTGRASFADLGWVAA
jgi:transposase